jgi:hypothetical protein
MIRNARSLDRHAPAPERPRRHVRSFNNRSPHGGVPRDRFERAAKGACTASASFAAIGPRRAQAPATAKTSVDGRQRLALLLRRELDHAPDGI